MFRIEIFCDDRRLAEVLRHLLGITIGDPKVQPVAEVQKGPNGSELPDLLISWARKKKLTEINSVHARQFCTQVGLSPKSYSYVLGRTMKAGLLKKSGKGTKSLYKMVAQ